MTPQELKNSILQLAIQGRLVEQRPEEGTAEELYRQIQREKEKLIKAGTIKKEKPLPEIAEEEKLFDIPESWMWVRLGGLLQVFGGISYDKNDVAKAGYRILRGGNIQQMKVILDEDDVFLPEQYRDEDKLIREGDILIVASTGSKTVIGKAGYVDHDIPNTMIGAFLRICRPYSFPTVNYLRYIFESEYYRKHIRELAQGTNINNVKESYITEYAIPFPPLAEQKRIVAKIEELLPLVDRYEKSWTRLEDFNKRFPADMQKSILQLAIQGRLVEQRPEEGTGEELYREIQREKEKLIKAGKIKKEKPLPEITEEEKPFEIPEGWRWVRLDDIMLTISAGKSFRCNEAVPEEKQPGIIKVSAVTWGTFKEDESKACLSENDWIEEYRVQPGDFLISRANTKKLVGACVIVEKIGKKLMLSDKILRIRFSKHLNLYFIMYIMRSEALRAQIEAVATGTSDSMKNISQKDIRGFVIPLPPVDEQKRIVVKLEELMPMCERLK